MPAVAVAAVAAREQAASVEAVECVPAELVEAARCAELASTGAVRLRVTAWRTPGLSRASRIQSRAGLTSAALADPTSAGLAGPTSVCLARLATDLAGAEEAGAEAGVEIIGRDMVGVQRP